MAEELDELIPVSDIKQYHFCPRIIYFTNVLGVGERITESEEEGKEAHQDFHQRERRRTTVFGSKSMRVKEKWTGYPVRSRKLGLQGLVDMVARVDDEYVVVEFKEAKAPKRVPDGHLYQAAAYALLVEEHFRTTVRRFMIHYSPSNKTIEVPLTESIRSHVHWTIRQILRIVSAEWLPPKSTAKCRSCGYRWVCRQA